MSRGAEWSGEDDRTVRHMHGLGRTTQEIADTVGRSFYATQKRIARLGLTTPRQPRLSDGDIRTRSEHVLAQVVQASPEEIAAVRRLVAAKATDPADEALLLSIIGVAS